MNAYLTQNGRAEGQLVKSVHLWKILKDVNEINMETGTRYLWRLSAERTSAAHHLGWCKWPRVWQTQWLRFNVYCQAMRPEELTRHHSVMFVFILQLLDKIIVLPDQLFGIWNYVIYSSTLADHLSDHMTASCKGFSYILCRWVGLSW